MFDEIYEEAPIGLEINREPGEDIAEATGELEEENVEETHTSEYFPDLSTLNGELHLYLNMTDALNFSSPVENFATRDRSLDTWQVDNNYYPVESDFDFIYDLSNGRQRITDLVINFGTSDLPRFSCSCHKLNIVVRHAISDNELSGILRQLSSSNSTVRNTISLNRFFKDHRFRLRLENPTRWGSAFLVLESVKRAYDRGAFAGGLSCPIPLATIENYIKVLKPAYELSTTLQLDLSSICDVVPSLVNLMTYWETLVVPEEPKNLCYKLIAIMKIKFKYELTSCCYKAAPLLKIANIKWWMDKPHGKKIISEGLHSLKEAYKLLCYHAKSAEEEEEDVRTPLSSPADSEPSTGRFFSNVFSDHGDPEGNGGVQFIEESELDKEISLFAAIISDKRGLKSITFYFFLYQQIT